jgi:uncharacterized protein (DUF2267 family)
LAASRRVDAGEPRPTSNEGVDYERFISIVEGAAGVGREPARRATQATLETLADRISKGEARDLADQLPPELAPSLATDHDAERFGVDEFLRRLAEREGVDLESARRHAMAVFAALGQAVSPDELSDLRSELPKDYAPLLPRGPYVDAVSSERFVRRVADRAVLGEDSAWRATEAVLETLAERISAGEVDDLVAQLPVQLHPPLKRGKEQGSGNAVRMSADEFVSRVAEREGVTLGEAREHARAVLTTLREAVPDSEFADVISQLPREYDDLLSRAP